MSGAENKAVFLSYASQDADAARRICEALRSGGVEVWFDADGGLEHGDEWDAKIRKQIKECVLFIPVISANTQARHEGYFRIEWELAAQRAMGIASGVAFILPVVVDDTRDPDALVPDRFRMVQWTKLPGGVVTPDVKARYLKLWSHRTGVLKHQSGVARAVQPVSSSLGDAAWKARAIPSRRIPVAAWLGALALIELGLVSFFALRPQPNASAGISPSAADKSAAPAPRPSAVSQSSPSNANPSVPRPHEKSIAVLPFANLSEEKDSAFFADGIHDDILTNLSNIRELHVISRTTVVQYRESRKTVRQIGEELGVAYLLEGTVRRAGKTVRVTGQLINARTDEHIWAKSFTRDLTDVFAIQSEVAQAIADALQAVLSPQEKKLIEHRPTDNLAAYELVLKARELHNADKVGSDVNLAEEERLLQNAVRLDPNYAIAYAELAYVYAYMYFVDSPSSADLAKAREAIDRAVQLAPGAPEVVRAQGDYFYYIHADYPQALAQYEKFAELRPNDPTYYNRVASIQRRQGRWAESLANFRKLARLDPGNLRNRRDIAILLAAGRRFDEAIEEQRRLVERAPDNLRARFELGQLYYLAKGSAREVEQFFTGLTPEQFNSRLVVELRTTRAVLQGDLDEALRLDRGWAGETRVSAGVVLAPDSDMALELATVLAAKGKIDAARARLGRVPVELRAQAGSGRANSFAWGDLGMPEALLGHNEEALRCVRQATELVPESRDALIGAAHRARLAFVYSWTGDKAAAIAEYAHLLEVPFGSIRGGGGSFPDATIHTMKTDPRYAPVRGDPRFEALLNDPKNQAPLF